jgi:hypothetical protein
VNDAVLDVAGDLDLDDVARGLWEPAMPHLPAAADGEDADFLAALEAVARGAGLTCSVPIAALLDAYNEGCRQLCRGLEARDEPEARDAGHRLRALDRVALSRISTGYSSGLEETIATLRRAVEEESPVDLVTGAIKPEEIADQLSVEVERCQRMDLSLGLIEMLPEASRAGGLTALPCRDELREASHCLRANLRRYDSIGATADGGFLLVLPDVSRRGLAGAAERLRGELEHCRTSVYGQMVFGLAHYDVVDMRPSDILETLDASVRQARSRGQALTWS